MRVLMFLAAGAAVAATPSGAAVLSSSANGFEIQQSVNLVVPKERAF